MLRPTEAHAIEESDKASDKSSRPPTFLSPAAVLSLHVRPRTRATFLVDGKLKPFDQQRLKHRRQLIFGCAHRHLGIDHEAIRIQPRRSDDKNGTEGESVTDE